MLRRAHIDVHTFPIEGVISRGGSEPKGAALLALGQVGKDFFAHSLVCFRFRLPDKAVRLLFLVVRIPLNDDLRDGGGFRILDHGAGDQKIAGQ